jgi:hypothetical protein
VEDTVSGDEVRLGKKIYVGVMVGVFTNAYRVCNDSILLRKSIKNHIHEFFLLNYNRKWIKHAAALVSLKVLGVVLDIFMELRNKVESRSLRGPWWLR